MNDIEENLFCHLNGLPGIAMVMRTGLATAESDSGFETEAKCKTR